MDETVKSVVISAVIYLARQTCPDLHTEPKYGGTVFMTKAGTPSTLSGGVYAYKDHVSVELSNGATFSDAANQLEGKGILRRHVKLHSLSDIAAKDVAGFLAQALTP
ncbi:DUF1801 domain-containing protein [bacterium]|nr:DUF1801 domain-containing protein [bacterium]